MKRCHHYYVKLIAILEEVKELVVVLMDRFFGTVSLIMTMLNNIILNTDSGSKVNY